MWPEVPAGRPRAVFQSMNLKIPWAPDRCFLGSIWQHQRSKEVALKQALWCHAIALSKLVSIAEALAGVDRRLGLEGGGGRGEGGGGGSLEVVAGDLHLDSRCLLHSTAMKLHKLACFIHGLPLNHLNHLVQIGFLSRGSPCPGLLQEVDGTQRRDHGDVCICKVPADNIPISSPHGSVQLTQSSPALITIRRLFQSNA